MLRFYDQKCIEKAEDFVQRDCLILNENIWSEGRKYYNKKLLSVLDKDHQLICFAYQDANANRQLRMLRELAEISEVSFKAFYPKCEHVTIYDCNELAYYFALYLRKQGILVNVVGDLWERLGWRERSHQVLNYEDMKIYAEGVYPKSGNFEDDIMRSAAVEFECIDKLYEYGIQKGLIRNAEGDFEWFLKQLRSGRKIILLGNEIDTLNAYDMLLKNDIDILGFLCDKRSEHRVLGKDFLTITEIESQCVNPILVECTSNNSAWGG